VLGAGWRVVTLVSVVLFTSVCAAGAGPQSDEDVKRPFPFLVSMDPETGERRWSTRADGPGVWRVQYAAEGLVYLLAAKCVVGGHEGEEIVAFDAKTGNERWRESVSGLRSFTAGTNVIVSKKRDTQLEALDNKTGELRWSKRLRGRYPAAVTKDLVLLADGPPGKISRLQALDRATGSVRWTYRGASPPFVADTVTPTRSNTAILTGHDDVRAIDLSTGRELWRKFPGLGSVWTIHDAPLFFTLGAGPDRIAEVTAHDVLSGDERWKRPIASEVLGRVFPTPWRYVDDVILFLADDASGEGRPGRLIAVNRDGETLWERESGPGRVEAARRGLFVISDDGELVGIDPHTATERWRSAIPGPFLYATAVSRNNVYFSGGCVLVSLPD
jgi:outer membrane protein assembly factor BamB